ncbi:MAG: EVE domain-containing protein [Planctomycetota bacterium]|jgi:predicted RNA-binding protein with PUA-like domain
MARKFWLFKSEPDVYPIEALAKDGTTYWDGVRNYQARNTLRDDIQVGDGVLFYHSRIPPMAVAGTAKVTRAGYPDPTQFDKKSKYYDEKATEENPRWYVVDIEIEEVFEKPVTLDEMRAMKPLEKMVLLQKGSRLSVQPVRKSEWNAIVRRAQSSR